MSGASRGAPGRQWPFMPALAQTAQHNKRGGKAMSDSDKAIDVFFDDITLVLDNDEYSYNSAREIVRTADSISEAGEMLHDFVLEQATDVDGLSDDSLTYLLYTQLLNFGSYAWERIAQHYLED
jgi:hypothetical protein